MRVKLKTESYSLMDIVCIIYFFFRFHVLMAFFSSIIDKFLSLRFTRIYFYNVLVFPRPVTLRVFNF